MSEQENVAAEGAAEQSVPVEPETAPKESSEAVEGGLTPEAAERSEPAPAVEPSTEGAVPAPTEEGKE